ncbi:glutathione S-transferase [Phascolomyces articulosus]|uniref:Glutathione S-transferase n=1 Tax=Phascolomyces articulosus TaxID=60185 RepID=A0AAD5KF24_9FUNG|nr:glutathione S-transferase [Phascolomyces articulosus]
MSVAKTVFYTAAICPFAQRAAIAFREIGLEHEKVEIDLLKKPSWYKDINPDGKVPSFTIQGRNIAESLVLVELANDLKPEVGLLPADPVKRAQSRYIIEYFSSKVTSPWYGFLSDFKKENLNKYTDALDVAYTRINDLLLEQSSTGPYFLGSQFSLADIGVASFYLRQQATHKLLLNDLQIEAVNKYPRVKEWLEGISSRPSIKETYPGDEYVIKIFNKLWDLSKF